MKKAVRILAIACAITTSFAPKADAAGWYTCTISEMGVATNGLVFITLTDVGGAFSNTMFMVDTGTPNVAERMLQLALYAAGKHRKVRVYVEPTPNSTIYSLIVVQ
jgi:hypothetical protein